MVIMQRQRMKDLLLRARFVVRTWKIKFSRRRLVDTVKKFHQKACRTGSTIIFPRLTNQIIDFFNYQLFLKYSISIYTMMTSTAVTQKWKNMIGWMRKKIIVLHAFWYLRVPCEKREKVKWPVEFKFSRQRGHWALTLFLLYVKVVCNDTAGIKQKKKHGINGKYSR